MKKNIQLFTDGACLGNPGPGGWAALLRYQEHEKMFSGGEKETTNNRMEMTAVLEGLKAIKEPARVHIISDSKYVIDAFEKNWIAGWLRNGWRNSQNKPVANREIWEDLIAMVKHHEVTWEWVKGHAGHDENERVDQQARDEAKKAQLGL